MAFGAVIRKLATSLALIVIVALGARIAFAWNQVSKIPPEALRIAPFQQEAGNIGFALAQGRSFSNVFRMETGPTAWLAPVYPLILAGIFKLFGIFTARAFFIAVGFNILCSASACVPIFFAGKHLGGLGVASAAAWLWAIFPNAILIPFEWIWDTSLTAFLAAAILWATLGVVNSEKLRHWCGYGLLWGCTLMTNPSLGSLLPVLLAWMAVRGRGAASSRWSRCALAAGLVTLCCLPWTIRNYATFHRLIPIRSNLPFELWLGNNDIFDEYAAGARRAITRTEEARHYAQLGETAFMREKWDLATTFMKTHPGLTVRLAGLRFFDFWLGTHTPLKNFREADSNLIRLILLGNFLTATCALLGLVVLCWRKAPATLAAAAFPVLFPCLYYLTHADLRLRHPIDPVVLLLTAIAAARAWELCRHRG